MYEVDFNHDVQLSLEFTKIKQLDIWLRSREAVAYNNKAELLFKYVHSMGYNITISEEEAPSIEKTYRKQQ